MPSISPGQVVGALLAVVIITFVVGLLIRLIAKFQPEFGSVFAAVLASAALNFAADAAFTVVGLAETEPLLTALISLISGLLVQTLLLVRLVRGHGGERLTDGQAWSVTLLELGLFLALGLLFQSLS